MIEMSFSWTYWRKGSSLPKQVVIYFLPPVHHTHIWFANPTTHFSAYMVTIIHSLYLYLYIYYLYEHIKILNIVGNHMYLKASGWLCGGLIQEDQTAPEIIFGLNCTGLLSVQHKLLQQQFNIRSLVITAHAQISNGMIVSEDTNLTTHP